MRRPSLARRELVVLAAILLLAAFVRFYDLRRRPSWYTDEGFHLETVQDMAEGRLAARAFRWTGFSTYHPYPALFFLVAVAPVRLLQGDILGLRLVSASASLATVLVVYLIGRRLAGVRCGAAGALVFALHPLIVTFSRFAFPHALAMLFVSLAVLRWLSYEEDGSAASALLSSLFLGLGAASVYTAAPLALVLWARLAWRKKWRLLGGSVAVVLAPLVLQVLAFGAVYGLGSVLRDAWLMLTERAIEPDSPGSGPWGELGRLLLGYGHISQAVQLWVWLQLLRAKVVELAAQMLTMGLAPFRLDYFALLGIAGLLLAPGRSRKLGLLAGFVLLTFEVARQKVETLDIFYYNLLPAAPLVAVGCGLVLARLMEGWHVSIPCTILLVCTYRDIQHLFAAPRTDLDAYCVQTPDRAGELARLVNDNTRPDDLAIATVNVSWLFRCRTTDLKQCAALLPGGTRWYPEPVTKDMLLYEPDLRRAKFLIVGQLDRFWTIKEPGRRERADTSSEAGKRAVPVFNAARILEQAERDGWLLEATIGEWQVCVPPGSDPRLQRARFPEADRLLGGGRN